jgi:hypothetical protein
MLTPPTGRGCAAPGIVCRDIGDAGDPSLRAIPAGTSVAGCSDTSALGYGRPAAAMGRRVRTRPQ